MNYFELGLPSHSQVVQEVYARHFSPHMNVYNLNSGELDSYGISISESSAYAIDMKIINDGITNA